MDTANSKKIKSLLSQGEGLTIEFKESKSKLNKDLYESVCAFLNKNGGHILLGVDDDGFVVCVDEQMIEQMQKDFVTTINNPQKLNPPFYLSMDIVDIEDKKILYIYVPQSKMVHSLNGKIFDRNNDSDIDITSRSTQVANLYLRKQDIYTEDKVFSYITMDDFDLELIKKVKLIASNKRVAAHPWENLNDFELLKRSGLYKIDKTTDKEGFTLGAVLLFGKDETIANVLPHYKTDLILREINLDRYDDREIVSTNLIDSYYQIIAFAKKHLKDPFYLESDVRVSLRDKIFREAVANSLIHREYSSAFVAKMIIEKDKVWFENANIPQTYGDLTPQNFTPYPKNPTIAKIFREIGLADELGSGVKNLFKYSKLYGGSDPVITDGDTFKLEIKRFSKNEPLNEPLNEPVKKLSMLIIENPYITKEQLSSKLNVSRATVTRYIKQLKDKGMLKRVGSDKTGYWKIIKKEDI